MKKVQQKASNKPQEAPKEQKQFKDMTKQELVVICEQAEQVFEVMKKELALANDTILRLVKNG